MAVKWRSYDLQIKAFTKVQVNDRCHTDQASRKPEDPICVHAAASAYTETEGLFNRVEAAHRSSLQPPHGNTQYKADCDKHPRPKTTVL
ncbi:hypothetical protein IG631_05213 [Alternaria alternata]|nr:hypothetical protein IG631_05213 [Alternaria alternata]